MNKIISTIFFAVITVTAFSQKGAQGQAVPCNGNADALPGQYTDHLHTKYPTALKGTAPEKAAMMKQLIAIEKTEEASRSNFQLTGCVARVSFSAADKNIAGNTINSSYGYQLGVYQNVCHVTEHIVKTVGEYRTVLRINVNPLLVKNYMLPGSTGEFYLTDQNRGVRYEIPIDAKAGYNYAKDRVNHPSRISQYISEAMLLKDRSDNYKSKHADFLKLINGDGYVENWLSGSRDDKPNPKAYKWVDRHYLITRPDIPLLVPVTRKQYLEDLLEYYEIEKANFYYSLEAQIKSNESNTSDYAKKRMAIFEADRAAYPQLYEARKEKIKQLLAIQSADWLQQPAVVDYNFNSYDANQCLADIGKFYDVENEKTAALYNYNPQYFKINTGQSVKPIFMELQFRYEIGEDRGFSERLFSNFLKNYDIDALRKMLE